MPADPPVERPPVDWAPLDWDADGQPRSRAFGDVYFSAEDGLGEARKVFLEGCGLPEAWAGRRRFVVGELGFGTGLNIAALLHLWRETRPAHGQLHVFSIEAYPVPAEDAERALARWPALGEISGLLAARWPGRARGRHRVELPELSAILDLAVMEVVPALAGWQGRADAWFLDGFAPAVNPQMWSDEVLALVAARSQPGARAATFTVAGQVRRGLAAQGFAVEKRPGFGRKRERLEARLPGSRPEPAIERVAILGAGIAGAAVARAIRALGGEAVVVEAERPGAGGSGNPAALVTPRLDAGLGEAASLFAQAFSRAVKLYREVPAATISRGVLQLAGDARSAERFAKIAAADLFEPGALDLLDAEAVSARLGESSPSALDQTTSLVVDPAAILAAWAGEIVIRRVARLEPVDEGWTLLDDEGNEILRAQVVIATAGLGSRELVADLPLRAVRGQASFALGAGSAPPAAWGGYVLPMRDDGLLFGATHDRDDLSDEVRADDHRRNLATLAKALPRLAQRLADVPLEGRASVRAVTPDRLPLAGEVADGLFVLTGFGSRGFSLAPLLAEHVAAQVLAAPSPIGLVAADLVDPSRFARRAARRGRSGS